MCACLLCACGDDSQEEQNDLRGCWYLEGSSNIGYTFEGFDWGGTGWVTNGTDKIRISWTFKNNILWTIISDNFNTDQKGYAQIIDGKLYWCNNVYTRMPDESNGTSSSGSSSDWAPSNPVGKIICWNEINSDGTAGNSNVRVKFDNSTDMSTNFSDWCTYRYSKLSPKKAHLNFMAPQRLAGVVRTFQYDFDLTFKTTSEFEVNGTLTVNYLSGPNIGSTVYLKFTGNGKFVDSLNGSDNGSNTGTPTPGKTEDIAKFVGDWVEESSHSLGQMSYTIKADGTYTYGYAMGLLRESGTFTCTSNTISLYVDNKFLRTLNLQNGKLIDNKNNKTFTKK